MAGKTSDQYFRNFFEQHAGGLFICNTKGKFLEVNASFCNLTGFGPEELKAMSYFDLLSPRVREDNPGKMITFSGETSFTRKDRQQIKVNAMISRDPSGSIASEVFYGNIEVVAVQNSNTDDSQTLDSWRHIVKNIHYPSALLDNNLGIIEVNNSIIAISGNSRENLTGRPCSDLFQCIPNHGKSSICPLKETSKKHPSRVSEMKISGSKNTYLVSCTPIYDPKGSLINFFLLATDITYLKHIEQELSESEIRYRALLDTIPLGIAVHCEGKVVFGNLTACKMIGAKGPEELIGKDISEIMHPATLPVSMDRVRRLINGEEGIYPAEDKFRTMDGSVMDVQIHGTLITYQGKPAIQLVVSDITEQNRNLKNISELERRFTNVMNSVDLVSIILDHQGHITFCNQYLLDLTGYTPSEIIHKNWFETFIPIEKRNEIESVFYGMFQTGKSVTHYENEIITKQGKRLTIAWNDTLLRGPDGKPYGMASIGENITDRKQAEEALRRSEQKFLKLFHSSPDAIILTRLDDRVIVDVNESACRITGYSAGEFIGNSIYSVKYWESEAQLIRYSELLKENRKVTNFEAGFRMKSGEIRTGLVSGEIIQLEDSFYVMGIIRDITERKKSEELLRVVQFGIDQAKLHIYQIDEEGHIRYANKQACCDLGYSLEEITLLKLTDLDPEVNLKDWKERRKKIRAKGSGNFISTHKRKDGSIFPVEITVTYFNFENKLYSFSFAKDISERKKSEEALILKNQEYQSLNEEYLTLNEELTDSLDRVQRINTDLEQARKKAEESDRLKTAFLQNMSHEIRTPLNAIIGFADILPNYFSDKNKLEKYTSIINQRGNDLLDIINDILDIAKLESGQLSVHLEEYTLNQVFSEIESFYSEYSKRIGKQDLRFSFHVQHEIADVPILIDHGKFKQILINLISNALKFTSAGTITIECRITEKDHLLLSVKDTGIGIPMEKQSAIFERFMQAGSETSHTHGGTGLGLSIVKGLLHVLGGTIRLESEPGKGSTFYVNLPFLVKGNI